MTTSSDAVAGQLERGVRPQRTLTRANRSDETAAPVVAKDGLRSRPRPDGHWCLMPEG